MGVGFRRFADFFATTRRRRRFGGAFATTRRLLRGGFVRLVRARCFFGAVLRLAFSAARWRFVPKNLICFALMLRRAIFFVRPPPALLAGFAIFVSTVDQATRHRLIQRASEDAAGTRCTFHPSRQSCSFC
jgi:hypothetical protein